MAYNESLANRVRESLSHVRKVQEKKMIGGLTFMVNDKMCVGIVKDELMIRIDPAVYEESLTKLGCHKMEFTGRALKGFVLIGEEGIRTKKGLQYWVELALSFNKKAKSSKKKR